jgi:hypothetical protein
MRSVQTSTDADRLRHVLGQLGGSGCGLFAEIRSAVHNGLDRLQQALNLVLWAETPYSHSSGLSFQLLRRISGNHQDENVRVLLV